MQWHTKSSHAGTYSRIVLKDSLNALAFFYRGDAAWNSYGPNIHYENIPIMPRSKSTILSKLTFKLAIIKWFLAFSVCVMWVWLQFRLPHGTISMHTHIHTFITLRPKQNTSTHSELKSIRKLQNTLQNSELYIQTSSRAYNNIDRNK